jgi:hypothetical protein
VVGTQHSSAPRRRPPYQLPFLFAGACVPSPYID